jgi:hypothetical protein
MIFFRQISFQRLDPSDSRTEKTPVDSAHWALGTDPALKPSPAVPDRGQRSEEARTIR